jgi:hypothetical protein
VATRRSGPNKGTFAPKFLPSKIACPSGTSKFAGACVEKTATTPGTDIFSASEECGDRGGQLPTAVYLRAYGEEPGVTLSGEESSSNIYFSGSFRALTAADDTGLDDHTTGDSQPFRCVFGVAKAFTGKPSGRIVSTPRASSDGSLR